MERHLKKQNKNISQLVDLILEEGHPGDSNIVKIFHTFSAYICIYLHTYRMQSSESCYYIIECRPFKPHIFQYLWEIFIGI